MHSCYPVAVHIFLFREGKILLMRRYNTGYEDGKMSVVAGHIQHGESAIQASVREIKEELDIIVNEDSLRFIGAMFRKSTDERVDWFLGAENWMGEPRINEPDKCDLLVWADMDNLPENTIPYIKKAIENFLSTATNTWIQEFGWDSNSAYKLG
jgi:ADP-ribose pyrophosphatase YjhB (NUDIX family)